MTKEERIKKKLVDGIDKVVNGFIMDNSRVDLVAFLKEEGFTFADMYYLFNMQFALDEYLDQMEKEDLVIDRKKFWQRIYDQADNY